MVLTLSVDGAEVSVRDSTSNVAALTDILVAKMGDRLEADFHF